MQNQSSKTRRNPRLSDPVRFGLWRVCGKLTFRFLLASVAELIVYNVGLWGRTVRVTVWVPRSGPLASSGKFAPSRNEPQPIHKCEGFPKISRQNSAATRARSVGEKTGNPLRGST